MNVGQMVAYIINSDVAVISDVTPVVNKKAKAPASGRSSTKLSEEQKEAKLQGMRNSVFKYITETDPDLLAAYRNWIDSVVGTTKANGTTAKLFQESIDSYTTDKSVKIQLINYSALRAYIDSRWAIEYYERNVSGRNTTEQKSAQVIGLNSYVEF